MEKRVNLNKPKKNTNYSTRKNTRPTAQVANNEYDEDDISEELDSSEEIGSSLNSFNNDINQKKSPIMNDLTGFNRFKQSFSNVPNKEKIKILMKNPVTRKIILVLALIAFFLLLIIYIIMVITASDGETNDDGFYLFFPNVCNKVKYGEEIMDLEEYITAVVAGEVTSRSDETLKAFAVAARTYLLHKTEQNKIISANGCYYDATNIRQAFHPEKVNDRHKNAVNETKGLIITLNGNVAGGHFDEACVYNASQASTADPSHTYSNDNYYIQYGREDVGGINFQAIPKTDLDKFRNHIEEYANSGTPCYKNHGMGMSQSGSEHLSIIKNYTWKEIIDFYYKGQAEIMSIYKIIGGYGDGAIYRQGDPAWGNIPLGSSSTNMAQSGCAVTSIAIGISFSGTALNVSSFNAGVFVNALNSGNCFTGTGAIKWGCSAISSIATSVRYVTSKSISGSNIDKINTIESYPLDQYIVITHFKNSVHARGHFVNFQEFISNDEYAARDPGPGSITKQKISEIDQIVIYSF